MIRRKTLLIRVDGNEKIGLGHFYRCLSLAQMLGDYFAITFAMAKPSDSLKAQLSEEGFALLELDHQAYTLPDEAEGNEISFDLEGKLGKIDIVLLDGYWFGPEYLSKLSDEVKTAIIEDKGSGSYKVDLIINHAPGVGKRNYQTDSKETYFALGPKYALLRPKFLKKAAEPRKSTGIINNVLVCFGGSDFHNYTGKIISFLLKNSDYRITAILGSAMQHKEEIKALEKEDPHRVTIKQNLSESQMLHEMETADAGIFPSSGILFEAIAAKLPIISGYYTSNQANIFEGFRDMGVIVGTDDFNEHSLRDALKKLETIDFDILMQKQQKCIDGQSPRRLNELFLKLC